MASGSAGWAVRAHPDPPSGASLNDAWAVSWQRVGRTERSVLTICRSTDAGQHWTVLSTFRASGTPRPPQFLDAAHGWLSTYVANGMHSPRDVHLFRTSDGGRHWRQVAARVSGLGGGRSFGGLPLMCGGEFRFTTVTAGWYVGGCGQGGGFPEGSQQGWAQFVAITHDGGAHWQPARLPHPRIGAGRAGCRAGAACTFTMVTLRPGLIELVSGGAGAVASVLYRSSDGNAWTVHRLPLASTPVATSDGVHLLQLAQVMRRLCRSHDRGDTWTCSSRGLPRPALFGPYPVTPRIAFLQASGLALYRTDDDGRTWTPVHPVLTRS